MHRLEQSIINIRNNSIMVIKLHLLGKSINDIASEVKLSKTEILEIIEKFNSD
jgi:DNA-binding Lrp family transcriptional regulator